MNPDLLIRGVLGSVLGGGGRKRSGRALRYLTGSTGSFWTRPATLMTAAGVAWGIYETLQQQPGGGASGGQWGGGGTSPVGDSVGRPLSGPPAASIPPIPGSTATTDVDAESLLFVQLAVSAANADGALSDKERAAIVQQAQSAGVGQIVERELNQPRPLAEIVGGVTDQAQRATLYVLAFTVLRADEQVNGAERIYLARLAHLLNLDPATVQTLEKNTGERIDALGDQGQLGG